MKVPENFKTIQEGSAVSLWYGQLSLVVGIMLGIVYAVLLVMLGRACHRKKPPMSMKYDDI